jgi:hypothetical protein
VVSSLANITAENGHCFTSATVSIVCDGLNRLQPGPMEESITCQRMNVSIESNGAVVLIPQFHVSDCRNYTMSNHDSIISTLA